jgi:hypothetical protein
MKTKKLTPAMLVHVQRENAATRLLRDGNAICPAQGDVCQASVTVSFCRETTQSNRPDSSTNLKSGQKSFSPCQDARFASRN